jgi:hypothetical protein
VVDHLPACQSCRAQHKKCRCPETLSNRQPDRPRRRLSRRRDDQAAQRPLPILRQRPRTPSVAAADETPGEVANIPPEDIDYPDRVVLDDDILDGFPALSLDDMNSHSFHSIGAMSLFDIGPDPKNALFDDDSTEMDFTLQALDMDPRLLTWHLPIARKQLHVGFHVENKENDAVLTSPAPSPMLDMIISSSAAFSSMPFPLTRMDQLALHTVSTEVLFSVGGTKHPAWSTQAIMLARGKNHTGVLRLLLAASLTELSFRQSTPQMMQNAAEIHYASGKEALGEMMHAAGEPDHLLVAMSFWFLYLRHRRWDFSGDGFRNISRKLSAYYRSHGLDNLLTSSTVATGYQSGAARLQASRMTCLARLTSWLFWADAAACFYGDGGWFARLLIGSSPNALSAIYRHSKSTLACHFGDEYPFDQIVDDNENELALELIHQTWIVVQEINEALDAGPVKEATLKRLGERVADLVCGNRYADVLRDAMTQTRVRVRHLANADWAASNLYALCIYFSRFCAGREPHTSLLNPKVEEVALKPATLMEIMDRSIDGGPPGQADRLQWPLFWGAIETRDGIHQKWILQHLSNPILGAALRAVQREQCSTGQRMGIDRIREICC